MLPLLYDDLRTAIGSTRVAITDEIDELEALLGEQGLAYDHKTRQVYVIADEDEEEE